VLLRVPGATWGGKRNAIHFIGKEIVYIKWIASDGSKFVLTTDIKLPLPHIVKQILCAGSKIYVCNGLAMVLSFFWARNVMGAFMLVNFFQTTEKELQDPKRSGNVMGPRMIWTYRVACVALTCLNAMWFYKMFKGALKVFTTSAPPKEAAERVERSQTES
jgi:hypothetical protein